MDAIADDSRLLTEHVARIDSTNSELLRREPLVPSGSAAVAVWLVADVQSGGRGRRQRTWLSTTQGSLTASLGYDAREPGNLGALSLAAGIAVAEALGRFGVEVRLKWPNDLHVARGKAGGILCEARARGALTRVVIGCGLNLLPPDSGEDFGQPVAGLFDPSGLPDPDSLSTAVGQALLAASQEFHEHGFESFRQGWDALDLLRSRAILIHDYNGVRGAIAQGIDRDGALLVIEDDRPGQLQRLLAEEVSVRPLAP